MQEGAGTCRCAGGRVSWEASSPPGQHVLRMSTCNLGMSGRACLAYINLSCCSAWLTAGTGFSFHFQGMFTAISFLGTPQQVWEWRQIPKHKNRAARGARFPRGPLYPFWPPGVTVQKSPEGGAAGIFLLPKQPPRSWCRPGSGCVGWLPRSDVGFGSCSALLEGGFLHRKLHPLFLTKLAVALR